METNKTIGNQLPAPAEPHQTEEFELWDVDVVDSEDDESGPLPVATQNAQKPVIKRENLTAPFITRVTKEEKQKMLQNVDDIIDKIKKRCAEEGRPCIL